MRIGRLRDRVRIDRPAHTSDGAGGQITTWATVATVFGELMPTGGGKDLEGGLISIGQQRFKLRMRYRADVPVDCRLVWLRSDGDAVDLRIDSIADPDGRRHELVAFVTAGVPT
jgi:head-tail adaptor